MTTVTSSGSPVVVQSQQQPSLVLISSPTPPSLQQQATKKDKKLLNKNLLLAYYATPVIISSSQILGLFISLSGIQYKFYDYLQNTGPKEPEVINNITNACEQVCKGDKRYSPVFEENAGSVIFNSLVFNTLIMGIFILTIVFSFLLHIVIRTAIQQHYKETEEEKEDETKIKITIKPVLYVVLIILFFLFIANIVLTSILIRIENFDRIKGGIFASISVGFILLVFVTAVSFAV